METLHIVVLIPNSYGQFMQQQQQFIYAFEMAICSRKICKVCIKQTAQQPACWRKPLAKLFRWQRPDKLKFPPLFKLKGFAKFSKNPEETFSVH